MTKKAKIAADFSTDRVIIQYVDSTDKKFNGEELAKAIKKRIKSHTHFMLLPKRSKFMSDEQDLIIKEALLKFSEEDVNSNLLMPLVLLSNENDENPSSSLLNLITWKGLQGIPPTHQCEYALQEELVDKPLDAILYGCLIPVKVLEHEGFAEKFICKELLGEEGKDQNDIYWQIGAIKCLYDIIDIDILCIPSLEVAVDIDYRMSNISHEDKLKLFNTFTTVYDIKTN